MLTASQAREMAIGSVPTVLDFEESISGYIERHAKLGLRKVRIYEHYMRRGFEQWFYRSYKWRLRKDLRKFLKNLGYDYEIGIGLDGPMWIDIIF